MTLHVAGRDVLGGRIAKSYNLLGRDICGRPVALLAFRLVAVDLDEQRVIDVISKRIMTAFR